MGDTVHTISGENTAACSLPASGFTNTLNEVYDWAIRVCEEVRDALGDGDISVRVWSYRHSYTTMIAADFYQKENSKNSHSLLFTAGFPHDFHDDEPYVPDMAEALHMIGIVTKALGAEIEIGRSFNEVNRYCTTEAWSEGQTNGSLCLPKSTG